MIEGPDGSLYGGALGHKDGGWNFQGVLGGLTRWTPNKNSLLDILTIKSNRTGFDLEFTEPLKAAEIRPENFWVVSYGVSLTIEGLAKGRVYHIFLKNELMSETGNKIFFPHGWFTLNEISDRSPLAPDGSSSVGVAAASAGRGPAGFRFDLQGRLLNISSAHSQFFAVKALRPSGRIVSGSAAMGRQGRASIRFRDKGMYILHITTPWGKFSKEITIL